MLTLFVRRTGNRKHKRHAGVNPVVETGSQDHGLRLLFLLHVICFVLNGLVVSISEFNPFTPIG